MGKILHHIIPDKIKAMKKPAAAVLSSLIMSAVAFPASMNDPKDEKAVMATLDAMAQATIKKDVATLDKIYHPDLTYSHSTASLQTKAQVLKAIASPSVSESMTVHESNILLFGNTSLLR